MEFKFTGKIWFWKGPSPWHFVTVPEDESREIHAMSSIVTYGWGMIPVTVHIGKTTWKTSLWPHNGLYIVPLKTNVRRAEKLQEGDTVTITLTVG